jgi:DNA polymerase-3 subunit beta
MKTYIPLPELKRSLGLSAMAAAKKSPKPILSCALLTASEDGTWLRATSLEVSMRVGMIGVEVDRPGSVVLGLDRIGACLAKAGRGTEGLVLEVKGDRLKVTTFPKSAASWEWAVEHDPDTFPTFPDPPAEDARLVVSAADLTKLIDRTVFAVDPESTRYALGGVKLEVDASGGGRLRGVATDGRRLSEASVPCSVLGEPAWPKGPSGCSVLAGGLKLARRLAGESEAEWRLRFAGCNGTSASGLWLERDQAAVYVRMVEGRFPEYASVFPKGEAPTVLEFAGTADLIRTAKLAAIATSDEAKGVVLESDGNGNLLIWGEAPDVGQADVECGGMLHAGRPVAVSFDPEFLVEALAPIDPESSVRVELHGDKDAFVLIADEYRHVIMPMTMEGTKTKRVKPLKGADAMAASGSAA